MRISQFTEKHGLKIVLLYFVIINLVTITWSLPHTHDQSADSLLFRCTKEIKNSCFTQYSPFFSNVLFVSRLPLISVFFVINQITPMMEITTHSIIIVYQRLFLLITGCIGIILIHRLTQLFTQNPYASFLSAVLLACNPIYIRYLKIGGKPDSYAWILILFFLYYYFKHLYAKSLKLSSTLQLSFLVSAGISAKYNMFFLYLPVFASFMIQGLRQLRTKGLRVRKNHFVHFPSFVLFYGELF